MAPFCLQVSIFFNALVWHETTEWWLCKSIQFNQLQDFTLYTIDTRCPLRVITLLMARLMWLIKIKPRKFIPMKFNTLTNYFWQTTKILTMKFNMLTVCYKLVVKWLNAKFWQPSYRIMATPTIIGCFKVFSHNKLARTYIFARTLKACIQTVLCITPKK